MLKRRTLKWLLAATSMLLVGSLTVIGYAAWQGNRDSDGNLTTGNVVILNIDAVVAMTTPGMTLVPFDQNPTSYDNYVSSNYLEFTVNVLSAEENYDLTLRVNSGTLAQGSELRISHRIPTALTDGVPIIEGGTFYSYLLASNATETTTAVSHSFFLFLVSSNLSDRNQPINFTVTISPSAVTP
jgi:hypothetical protein